MGAIGSGTGILLAVTNVRLVCVCVCVCVFRLCFLLFIFRSWHLPPLTTPIFFLVHPLPLAQIYGYYETIVKEGTESGGFFGLF